jgi:hypothetical protein
MSFYAKDKKLLLTKGGLDGSGVSILFFNLALVQAQRYKFGL